MCRFLRWKFGLLQKSTFSTSRVNYKHLNENINILPKFKKFAVNFKGTCLQYRNICSENSSATSARNQYQPVNYKSIMETTDNNVENDAAKEMLVFEDFINESEENFLIQEIEPTLKRMRYQYDHWDGAIEGYREIEKGRWSDKSQEIIERIREIAFPPDAAPLAHVHVLDLDEKGHIKPHIDSTRFCGGVVAGLSLMSNCVMRLVPEHNKDSLVDVILRRKSLYVMRGKIRYNYTHEVLGPAASFFRGQPVTKGRRISIVCRCEPDESDSE